MSTSAHFRDQRALAERHPCPRCMAPAGEPCRNLITGERLGYQPAHLARLRLAQQAEATP